MTNNHVSLHIQAIPSPPGFNYGKNKSFYKATLPHKKPIFHTFVWVYPRLKARVHPKKIFLQIRTFQGIYSMFQHMTANHDQQLHVWVSCYHGNEASWNKLLKSTPSLRKKWAKTTKLNDLKIFFADGQYECLCFKRRILIYFK